MGIEVAYGHLTSELVLFGRSMLVNLYCVSFIPYVKNLMLDKKMINGK